MAYLKNMRVVPYFVFFPASFLFLVGLSQGGGLWLWTGFLYAVMVGFVWTVLPLVFKTPTPMVKDLFPIGMLFLFLFVLCETRGKVSSDSLFYTVSALVLFRTLYFVLKLLTTSTEKVGTGIVIWIIAFVFQFGCDLSRVYRSFHPSALAAAGFPIEDPLWLQWISLRVLLFGLALGWGWMNRKGARALIPGAILSLWPQYLYGSILLFGAGIMVELWLYQRNSKKTLS